MGFWVWLGSENSCNPLLFPSLIFFLLCFLLHLFLPLPVSSFPLLGGGHIYGFSSHQEGLLGCALVFLDSRQPQSLLPWKLVSHWAALLSLAMSSSRRIPGTPVAWSRHQPASTELHLGQPLKIPAAANHGSQVSTRGPAPLGNSAGEAVFPSCVSSVPGFAITFQLGVSVGPVFALPAWKMRANDSWRNFAGGGVCLELSKPGLQSLRSTSLLIEYRYLGKHLRNS